MVVGVGGMRCVTLMETIRCSLAILNYYISNKNYQLVQLSPWI